MRDSMLADFLNQPPRVLVLDDYPASRDAIARRFRREGFEVVTCSSVEEFDAEWSPGMFDLVVADWQLQNDRGDHVLKGLRTRDWEVPFVLVSGKLTEDNRRADVLHALLKEGLSSFVTRGEEGIEQVHKEGVRLLERRDLTLLRVILALRKPAAEGAVIRTTTGQQKVSDQLAELVANPESSKHTLRPLSKARGDRFRADDGRA